MAVVTRRRGVRVLMVVAAGFPLLLAGGAALLTVVMGGTCTGSGVGDAPSALAIRDIPASFLRIYEQVGAQFKIPWEVLAGIGQEECDQGRLPDPSCTPRPGATGPGVANFAGASGPMQIGVGGLAGDEYQSLRRYLPDPSLGPHDPTTAVELAALVLIRDKGAPTGQPIDAYAVYVRAYNGSGPAADAYAARVLADAHAYQGAGTAAFGPSCSAALGTPLVAGTKARILPSGDAAAPADAPVVVQHMIAAGNRIDRFPYSYAGGHGAVAQTMNQTAPDPAAFPGRRGERRAGLRLLVGDRLRAVRRRLRADACCKAAHPPRRRSRASASRGPGSGSRSTPTPAHAYIEVAGIYFDTAAGLGNPPNPPSTGPRWSTVGTGPAGLRRAASARALTSEPAALVAAARAHGRRRVVGAVRRPGRGRPRACGERGRPPATRPSACRRGWGRAACGSARSAPSRARRARSG